MRFGGAGPVRAPVSQVWAALRDPAVLARAIPGCERLEPAGPGAYRFTVTASVASAQGTYAGTVSLVRQREPVSFALTVHAAGAPGTVRGTVQVTLTAAGDGTTEVSYDADAALDGLIAGLGQRLVAATGQRLAGEFAAAIDTILTDQGAAPVGVRAAQLAAVSPAAPAGRPVRAFLGGAAAGAAVTAAGVAAARLVGRRMR